MQFHTTHLQDIRGSKRWLGIRTTSDFSEKIESLMHSRANHLMGSFMLVSLSSCLKYSLDVSMVSESPKSATLITKLTSILKIGGHSLIITVEQNLAMAFSVTKTYIQFLAARSRCTMRLCVRYSIPLPT